MSLITFGIIYAALGLITGLSFWYVNEKYYKNLATANQSNLLYGLSLLLTATWPIGLPVFLYHYKKIITSVVKGRDWADDSDVSEAVKKLMRMNESDAVAYLKSIEENFVRQISGDTVTIPKVSENTGKSLN
jgi:hypothetical protein